MRQKIRIHINDPLEAPQVFIDENIYPIASIEYDYETSTDACHGSHRLIIEYADEDGSPATIYTGFEKKV